MKKITGSLLVCTGAALFAATALLTGPVASRPSAPNPATVPAANAAAPPITAADGGPVDGSSGARHGNHGASSPSSSPSSTGAGAPGGNDRSAAPTGSATLRITGFAFETRPVSPGATVTVTNDDQAPHTVTAQDGSFSASVPAGGTTTFIAPSRAGSFAFFCEIHPQMTGTLSVR